MGKRSRAALDGRRSMKNGLYFRWRFQVVSLRRNLFLYEGQPCVSALNVAVADSINPLKLDAESRLGVPSVRIEPTPFGQNPRCVRRF
jgi:hypothetical protein